MDVKTVARGTKDEAKHLPENILWFRETLSEWIPGCGPAKQPGFGSSNSATSGAPYSVAKRQLLFISGIPGETAFAAPSSCSFSKKKFFDNLRSIQWIHVKLVTYKVTTRIPILNWCISQNRPPYAHYSCHIPRKWTIPSLGIWQMKNLLWTYSSQIRAPHTPLIVIAHRSLSVGGPEDQNPPYEQLMKRLTRFSLTLSFATGWFFSVVK